MLRGFQKFLKTLGPGVITGAADDDPSGIATYSQAGAQFGMGAAWVNLYLLPLQAAVQEACARIGAVQGKGLAAVVKQHYPRWVLLSVVGLVFVANTINIGADIGAMAEALHLVVPYSFVAYTLIVTVVILLLEIFTSYRVYSNILKWLAITLFVYPLTLLLIANGSWVTIVHASFVPWFELSFPFFFILVGIAGTTISPYMFFWQAGEEVEEEKQAHLIKNGRPRIGRAFIHHLRVDNLVGMVASSFAAWAIVVLAALVLFPNGITDIAAAADAARALEPLVAGFPNAGFLSKLLFAGGIISLGFLSVPVLSGSAAYAVAETYTMREGLNLKPVRAKGFYGVMALATVVGLAINYLGIDPIKALVYSAVLNGVIAAPLVYIIGKLAADKQIMGKYRSGILSRVLVSLTVIVMGIGTLGIILTIF